MGFFSNLFNLGKSKQKVEDSNPIPNTSYNLNSWPAGDYYGNYSYFLTNNPEIFSIVSRISSIFASLPIHMYQDGAEKDDDVSDLLRVEPNPNMSGFKLLRRVEADRNVSGNGFIFIVRDRLGTPTQLLPISHENIMMKRNTDDNSIWYEVNTETMHVMISSADMIHVNQIESNGNTDWGISPIDVLNGALKFQKTVQDFSMDEMSKKNSYIVKYDRSVSPERRQAILNDIASMERNNGGALLQESGFDINRYEDKFQPADLQASEAISRTRIANAFNVPLSFLNDGNAKSTVNVEHVMTQFVETTLTPIVKQYEGEFNRKLVTKSQRKDGYYLKFNVNGLMRGDTAARTQFYQMGVRNGIFTINEMRKLEDLPPVDDKQADTVWFSGDLYPLDQAGQRVPQAHNLPNDTTTTKGGEESGNSNSNADQGKDA